MRDAPRPAHDRPCAGRNALIPPTALPPVCEPVVGPMTGSSRSPIRQHDVVIVGARAAGASTALLLARAGLDVAVVDRGRYGADTLSTHAIMRAGTVQLHRWGVLDTLVAAG